LKLKIYLHKRASRLSASVVIAAALAACSSSDRPSESEARTALEAYLGNCQYIDVSDFRKVNGIPQEDGTYIVKLDFSAKITPTDAIKNYLENKYLTDVQTAENTPGSGGKVRQDNAIFSQEKALIGQACPHTPYRFIENAFQNGITDVASFDKPFEVQVTDAQITMIKTDNGWQLAQ